jgi:hypothetical protein
MRRSILRGALVSHVLLVPMLAHAQQTSITGKVSDASGASIAGAAVTAQVTGGASYHTVSDKDGIYQFPGVQAADYSIKVEDAGFNTVIEKVTVLIGTAQTANVVLTASGGNTTVTVTSEALAIDTTTSQVAGQIDPDTFKKLPLNGRNYLDLAQLVPGIRRNAITNNSPLGSLNGGRQQFNLDNQQVTSNGADSSFGQPQFSRDALSQFQIITSQFDATQGRTDQLVMNLQSKSGVNQLHGSAFGYFRNDVFDAADPVTRTVLPFSDQQYGGTIGGPIKHDKLWFFASYEGEHRPQQTNTVPFGFTPASFSYANTLKNNEYLGRLDYQPDEKDHIFGRFYRFDTASPDLLPSGNASISRQYTNSVAPYGMIASWTRNISPNLVNTLFGSWYYTSNLNSPLVPSIQFTMPSATIVGAAYNYPSHLPVSVFQFRDDAFWLKGKHSIKFGLEYLRELNNGSFPQNIRGVANLAAEPRIYSTPIVPVAVAGQTGCVVATDPWGCESYDQVFPNQLDPSTWDYKNISKHVSAYTQGFGNFNTNINRNIFGTWFQDDWKIRPNLTLNMGLRYDNDLGLITAGNNTVNGIISPQHGNNANFSPRLGVSYDIFGKGKTVLRAGLGVYYAEIIANQSIDAQLFNGVQTVQAAVTQAALNPATFNILNPFAGQDTSAFIANPQNVVQAVQVQDKTIRTPWSGTGSIGIQQDLSHGVVASIDYSQLRVHHDWSRLDQNTVLDPSTGWNAFNVGSPSATCPTGCVTSRVQPNTHYSTIATFHTDDAIANQTKSLMVSVRDRTSFGFTGLLAYTYGLQKDNSSGPFSYASNPYNPQNEWGNSVDDQRHTLSATGNYQWKWGISGGLLYHFGSGLAYATTVSAAPTALVLSSSSNRSYCLARVGTICSHASSLIAKTYNDPKHDHFDAATGLTTTDRNSFRGLPIERLDANLNKVFTIKERFKVTTTVEAFNLLNHSNFGSYNTVVSSATYGTPLSTSGVLGFYARQLQFAARLDF